MARTRKTTSTAVHAERYDDSRDRIAMRAYELYLARGASDGRDFDDWLAAERELNGGAHTSTSREDAEE